MPDAGLRLRLYRRMATLDAMQEIDEMAEELADRFGEIPDPVNNLLYQLRVKSLALKAGVPGGGDGERARSRCAWPEEGSAGSLSFAAPSGR